MRLAMGKLSFKFMFRFGLCALGWILMHSLETEVRSWADQSATDQIESILTLLQTVDSLSSQSIRAAMNVLLQEGGRIGVPETDKLTTLEGQPVPDLRLGPSSQVGNFD
jgi:hypothetical protein